MSKRESKKAHILKARLDVMKAQGYNGCSVKDIVDAAGVPKGSFYNYFESKEAFAVEALEAMAYESYLNNRNLLASGDQPPLQRLRQYFRAVFAVTQCSINAVWVWPQSLDEGDEIERI